MAQIKLLKIGADGYNTEFDSAADEITLNSFSAGSGPKVSTVGIDMNNTDLSEVQDIDFQDPSTSTIEQSAGALVIDNIMAKERNNIMSSAGAVLFPSISDVAAQVDSLKIPHIAGTPTATPAFSSDAGYMVYDDSNNKLYVWDGAAWDDQSVVSSASNIDDSYTASGAILIRDVVQLTGNDLVAKAVANSAANADALGLAVAAASDGAAVSVRKFGSMSGFSGLVAGSRYYLDPSSAGAITATLPVGAGNYIVQVGIARNATTLEIAILPLSRRAS